MLRVKAAHGETERTKAQEGVFWAGTNLPEEYLECEAHIKALVDSGYSYMYMERYLMSAGYGLNVIRKAFRKLTGIDAECAVNFDYVQSPGNIPQFSMGWGEVKGKKGQHLFIMPMANKYAIFHQVDDMTRLIVEEYHCLAEAIESASKKVTKLQRWDPPIKDVMKDKDMTQLYKQPQLFMKATAWNWLQTVHSTDERQAYINQAYTEGRIDDDLRGHLLKVYCDSAAALEQEAVLEEAQKSEERAWKQDIGEMMRSTPAQELTMAVEPGAAIPLDSFARVQAYLEDQAGLLTDFTIRPIVIKWATEQIPGEIPEGVASDDISVSNIIGLLSVILEVIDNTIPGNNIKQALMVFDILSTGEFRTPGVIKEKRSGERYDLGNEGLAKMFELERAQAQEMGA